MKEKLLPMGTLATEAGVNRETIRFYQRNGLMNDISRTPTGYRQFTKKDLNRVLFIRKAKDLGFSLAEIRELLTVADGEVVRCPEVKAIAERALNNIDSQLVQLKQFQKVLSALVKQCGTARRVSGCPIIEELTREE